MGEIGDNRLTALASEIVGHLAAMRATAAQTAASAIRAGEALVEAKAAIPHGQWSAWLQANCSLSERSARRYMRLVELGLRTATVADLGLTGALAPLARLRFPRWGEVVRGKDGGGWQWVIWLADHPGKWFHAWAFHYERAEEVASIKPFAKRVALGQLETFGVSLASLQFDAPFSDDVDWFRHRRAEIVGERHPLWARPT